MMSQKLMVADDDDLGRFGEASTGSASFLVAVGNDRSMFSLDNHSEPQHTEPDAY